MSLHLTRWLPAAAAALGIAAMAVRLVTGRRRDARARRQHTDHPGLPVDGDPLDADELARFTGCGMASMTAFRGLTDPDTACGACQDGECTGCYGAAVSGPCMCPHAAIAPRLGGGRP